MASANPASGFVTANGVRLHYLDYGGDGPPAVLHHATGFHAWMWQPIADRLSVRYHVIALDARGHGDSEKPATGYSWETFIADLVGFVEALDLAGGLGVGHSLGGTVTSGAAAERAGLFTHVVALDPILIPREFRNVAEGDNPMSEKARKRRPQWGSVEEAVERYRGRGPFAEWTDEPLRRYVEHGFAKQPDGTIVLKCPPEIEAQAFGMAPHFESWSIFDRLAVPTLLMRGSQSDAFSANDATKALGRLREGELHTVAGTHMFPMEKPDEVVDTISAFVDSRLPIATRGLAHLALNVVKLEETVAFYREVFGMRIVWQPDAENVYMSSGRDNLALHRAAAPRAESGSPLDHLGFLVESAARVHAIGRALERVGRKILRPPRDHRDGSTSLYLEDPDGNVVQVLYEPHALRRGAARSSGAAADARQ
jgi:pimeloyl-ACP methyl ester carboxylesterase/catechol 2,3-dioxygenase-like lactoylglutathione lyase family enzyme